MGRSVQPVALSLEWIGRQRQPMTPIIPVEPDPVDPAADGKMTEAAQQLLPVFLPLTQAGKPDSRFGRQAISPHPGQGRLRTDLDEGAASSLGERRHARHEFYRLP